MVMFSSPEVITSLKEANICTPSGIPLSPRSYVDDYAIMAVSNSLGDNLATLSLGLESVVDTLARIGMTCDTTKLDLQHFTRRPSDTEFPSLVVDVYGKRVTIAAPKSMRWLGIFFDRRLSFHEHAKIMAARAKTVVNGLRCLGNTVRGLSQANMRVLYRTCAFPILTYAAPVWFREDKRQKGLVKLLDTTQNKALKLICGTFRTTPCFALRVLGHIPPIVHLLRRLSEAAALRFTRLHPLSPIVQRLPNDWRQRHRPTEKTPFSTPHTLTGTNPVKHTIIQHLSTKSNPDAERLEPFHSDNAPWHVTAGSLSPRLSIRPIPCDIEARPAYSASLNRELISSRHDPTLLLVYSDGSRWKPAGGGEKSGYGVVIYHCAVPIASFSIGLGRYSTVFDAEMFALAHASSKVKKILDAHTVINRVKFYSDSTSSLKVIFEPSAHPAQQCSLLFRSNIIDLLDRMPNLEIDVGWSPGHTDIIGNEAADRAAKAGVKLPSLIFRTHSYAGMSSKMRAQTRWRKEWSEDKAKRLIGNTPSAFELADVQPPRISPNDFFRSTPRELFGRLTQTLTGHGYTGEYYRRFVPSETTWCRCTDTEVQHVFETREHILHECDRYAHHRPLLENRPTSLLFGSKSGITSLILFMRKSGAFTKSGHPRPDPIIRFGKKPRDRKPP
jgi:ribonuclease HI